MIKKLLIVVGAALVLSISSPITASAFAGQEPACGAMNACW
ncbi:hypothetical protein [Kribbella hippodromi]